MGIWFCLAGISGISGIWNLGLGLIVLLIGGQDGRMGGVGGFVWVRQGRVAVLEVLFENDHLFGRMVMVV